MAEIEFPADVDTIRKWIDILLRRLTDKIQANAPVPSPAVPEPIEAAMTETQTPDARFSGLATSFDLSDVMFFADELRETNRPMSDALWRVARSADHYLAEHASPAVQERAETPKTCSTCRWFEQVISGDYGEGLCRHGISANIRGGIWPTFGCIDHAADPNVIWAMGRAIQVCPECGGSRVIQTGAPCPTCDGLGAVEPHEMNDDFARGVSHE